MASSNVVGGEHRLRVVEAVVAYAVWGMREVVQRWRATPKTQNRLSCDSALSGAMTSESCASSACSQDKACWKRRAVYGRPRAFVGVGAPPSAIREGWSPPRSFSSLGSSGARSRPYTVRTDDTLKVRFSAAEGEEPEVEVGLR
jgi:hypothetical protein